MLDPRYFEQYEHPNRLCSYRPFVIRKPGGPKFQFSLSKMALSHVVIWRRSPWLRQMQLLKTEMAGDFRIFSQVSDFTATLVFATDIGDKICR